MQRHATSKTSNLFEEEIKKREIDEIKNKCYSWATAVKNGQKPKIQENCKRIRNQFLPFKIQKSSYSSGPSQCTRSTSRSDLYQVPMGGTISSDRDGSSLHGKVFQYEQLSGSRSNILNGQQQLSNGVQFLSDPVQKLSSSGSEDQCETLDSTSVSDWGGSQSSDNELSDSDNSSSEWWSDELPTNVATDHSIQSS